MTFHFQPHASHTDRRWDPEEVLKLPNADYGYGITCVAEAKTYGRRCRRYMAASKSFAPRYCKLFDLSPSDAADSIDLYRLADSLSCWQHKGQVDEIVSKWQHRLRTIDDQGKGLDRTASLLEELYAQIEQMTARAEKLEQMRRHMEQQGAGGPFFNSRNFSDEAARDRAKEKRRKAGEEARKEEEQRYQQQEAQRKEKEKAEREARARAEEIKAKARRRAEEREAAERREWSDAWARYCSAWAKIEATEHRKHLTAKDIPWPTKSGKRDDATEANIRMFFKKCVPVELSDEPEEEMYRAITKENLRWHTDKIQQKFGVQIFKSRCASDIHKITELTVRLRKEAKMARKL